MPRKFTTDHEWLDIENGAATVGVTQYAQAQLGDIVFIELPSIGRVVSKGEPIALVESVKAASEIYAPVNGVIVLINESLQETPEKINVESEGSAWIFQMQVSDLSDIDSLLDKEAYDQLIS
jgi:glycine cleavage system H protein